MTRVPYTQIEYDIYQCDRPNQSPYEEIRRMGNTERNQMFEYIGLQVCQYTYNKLLEKGSGQQKYRIYITFTKHTCCCMSAEIINNGITQMWFSDVEVIKKDENYIIREIKSYKMNKGEVPELIYFAENSSTYGLKFTKSTVMPYKWPLLGISNKKMFLPPRSMFLEGNHQDVYVQPYLFNWISDNDPNQDIYENLLSNPSNGFEYKPKT